MLRIVLGRGNVLEDRVEQRLEVVVQLVGAVVRGVTGTCVRVDDREVDLLLGGVEIEEQGVRLVEHLGDASVGTIDLVDHEDHREVRLERLAQHEARLREGTLAGIDEQDDRVDHGQSALDLAAEVGVARRVDDVDLRLAVPDRRVLGEDRDALLALQIVRVHDPLADVLIGAEGTRLPQHGVDECRLPVIDVRDDRNVSNRFAAFHRRPQSTWGRPLAPPVHRPGSVADGRSGGSESLLLRSAAPQTSRRRSRRSALAPAG